MSLDVQTKELLWNKSVIVRLTGHVEMTPTMVDGRYRIAGYKDLDHQFKIDDAERKVVGISYYSYQHQLYRIVNSELHKLGVEGEFIERDI